MGRPGALTNVPIALAIALILLLSGPGASLASPAAVHPETLAEPSSTMAAREAPLEGPRGPAGEHGPGQQSLLRADFPTWNSWSLTVPLDQLEQTARADAPEVGKRLIPTPDTLPGHDQAPEEVQREAWRSWWLATDIAAMRSPNVPLDPLLDATRGPQESMGIADDHEGETSDLDTPLGEPRGLERLWRLQAHGPPRIVLPADDGGEMYLVTDRGVLFIPEAGERPDWMLNIDGIAGHAEVVERDGDGLNDLVIGVHNMHLDETSPSIWVIDGATQEVSFHGLRGDHALMHWTLTDVDGDGEKDILGIDRSSNVSAVKLDGSEIYRTPLPMPDLPELTIPGQDLPDPLPTMESFPVLALVRTGVELFGDATGDGTMDLFTTSFWGPFLFQSTAWVTLVDGSNGEEVWSRPLEPKPAAIFRLTTPTATGDLTGDDLADVGIYDLSYDFTSAIGSPRNIYLAGETGFVVGQDPSPLMVGFPGLIEEPFPSYVPVAFVDLDDDGVQEIVAMEGEKIDTDWDWYRPAVHIRTLGEVPGGPTTLQERIELDVPWHSLYGDYLQIMEREVDGKELVVFLSLQNPYYEDEHDDTVFILDGDGFHSTLSPEPIGHFDIHPVTGQGFVWTQSDDRFTPVDRDLVKTGNGTRLIMSASPLLAHSIDGGVPDLLIPRTMGYFWVSGRTGAILDTVDRPLNTRALQVVDSQDEALLLERTDDGYALFDVVKERTLWNATQDAVNDAGNVRGIADFTGDGKLEIFFHRYGGYEFECDETGNCQLNEVDDRWSVYSPEENRFLWELEGTEYRVLTGPVTKSGPHRLLVVEEEDSKMALHNVDEDEVVWSKTTDLEWIRSTLMENGHVVVSGYNEDNDLETHVYDAETGTRAHSTTVADDEEQVWTRLVEDAKGKTLIVESFAYDHPQDEDKKKQYVRVTDLEKAEATGDFDVTDAVVITETVEFFGSKYTYSYTQYTWSGPVLGEWNDDGSPAMAFREDGWPSVRSLKNGDVLAVGPMKGSFNRAIDLNGDGRSEVGLGTWGSLRMYAYDPSGQQMEREDPLQRVDAVDPDQGDQNATDFFDRDKENTPAPGLGVLVVILVGLALAGRRRRT